MLLSCCLWILYGLFDPDESLIIITVNAAGLTLQALYITLFLIYPSNEERVKYFGFVILDVVFFGVVVAVTLVVFQEASRRTFMGVLCATLTVMIELDVATNVLIRFALASKRLVIPLHPDGPEISCHNHLAHLSSATISNRAGHRPHAPNRSRICRPPVYPGSHMRINNLSRGTIHKDMVQVLHRNQARRALIRAACHSSFHEVISGR
ncbi:SWEET sugar transporter [Cynara cardunculus var. scolymus]|uniref:SWEET sugar transporter n=1 Tax=Cynara cardunculus var. scolymus TaxID=59895 RepID=A0A103Y394_CYNCS|nr:SWEET sugar transporter [Cynara cardunculus var. scolymus]